MIFKKLIIKNFQGCNFLEVPFSEKTTSIVGRNGAGKTTVLDAISWVLFGKDIENKKKFDIAKIKKDGSISTESIIVTLLIMQEDTEHVLTRCLNGSKTTCTVDDVPYSITDYAAYVGQLTGGEERFKLYSNPLYFFELHWTEQRELLLGFFPSPSDELVLSEATVSKEFSDKLKTLTAEQIKSASKAKIKEIAKRQTELRGQEAILTESCEYNADDISGYEKERCQILSKLNDVEESLASVDSNNKIIYSTRKQNAELLTELETIRANARSVQARMKTECSAAISGLRLRRDKLLQSRKDCVRSDGVCPMCHRPFDAKKIAEMELAMDNMIDKISVDIDRIDEEIVDANLEMTLLESSDGLTDENRTRISEIATERAGIADILNEEPLDRNGIMEEQARLMDRRSELDKMLARKDVLAESLEKMDVVKSELLTTAGQMERHELFLADADAFISARTRVIVNAINSKFATLRVKLFDTLKSGEYTEAFKITQYGIPYSALNKGQRLRVALELVKFLKESLDVEAPIMFDDGESYDSIIINGIGGQVIVTIRQEDAPLMIHGGK